MGHLFALSPYGDVMVLLLQDMILPYPSSHCLFSLHCVCTTNTCTGGDCHVLLVDVTTWFLPNIDLCWEACSCTELRSTKVYNQKSFPCQSGFCTHHCDCNCSTDLKYCEELWSLNAPKPKTIYIWKYLTPVNLLLWTEIYLASL